MFSSSLILSFDISKLNIFIISLSCCSFELFPGVVKFCSSFFTLFLVALLFTLLFLPWVGCASFFVSFSINLVIGPSIILFSFGVVVIFVSDTLCSCLISSFSFISIGSSLTDSTLIEAVDAFCFPSRRCLAFIYYSFSEILI